MVRLVIWKIVVDDGQLGSNASVADGGIRKGTCSDETDLGRAAIAAYAERANVSVEQFTKRLMPALTPAIIGDAVVDLHQNPSKWDQLVYRIGGGGLVPVS